jgi:hypothetical protein
MLSLGDLAGALANERPEHATVVRELGEARRERFDGKYDVGDLGRDDGSRHRRVRRLARVLHEHDPARLLDRACTERTVRAAAGQHHGEAVAVPLRERAKEHVDRGAALANILERRRGDGALREFELTVRAIT